MLATLTRDTALATTTGAPRLMPVGDRLWRVVDVDGRALGHLLTREEGAGRRYVARRFHPSSRSWRDIGEFWTPDEAIECLRFSR